MGCTSNSTTCSTTTPPPPENAMNLLGGRFRVQVSWKDSSGNTGPGKVVEFGTADSGLFWFFGANNWEMLVKMVDGCAVNNKKWFFSAATTNVGYTITVTDTQTGAVKTYVNPVGVSAAATTDTNAFNCP
jgi:hypothetical protein